MAKEDVYLYCETQPEYEPEWHWITEQIALGSYPLNDVIEELCAQGVTAICSVRWDEPDYDLDRFVEAHVAQVDDGCPFPFESLVSILQFVHRNVMAGRKVYVHCFAGISRSAFVVASYLMLTEDIPFAEALARVRSIRSKVNPHPLLFDRGTLDYLQEERARILSIGEVA